MSRTMEPRLKIYPTIQEACDAAPIVTVAGVRLQATVKPWPGGSGGYASTGEYWLVIGPIQVNIGHEEYKTSLQCRVAYHSSAQVSCGHNTLSDAADWCSRALAEMVAEVDKALETVRRFHEP